MNSNKIIENSDIYFAEEIRNKFSYAKSLTATYFGTDSDGIFEISKKQDLNGSFEQSLHLISIFDSDVLPETCPTGMNNYLWEYVVNIEDKDHPSAMTRFGLLATLITLENSLAYLCLGQRDLAIKTFGFGCWMLGRCNERGVGHSRNGIHQPLAKKANLAKLASDPKQKAKKQVHYHWKQWQKAPSLYPTKAAFAREMLEKFGILKSQAVIVRWCNSWSSKK